MAAWEEDLPNRCSECERARAHSKLVQSGGPGGGRSALRASKASEDAAMLSGLLCPTTGHGDLGSLQNGRVFVTDSTLGRKAGLGLFAGVAFCKNEPITTYAGPTLYREQLLEGHDTSYVLRVPNSGGALIDGKPYADSIRSNPANPDPEGRYFPRDGAAEWTQGAASMANDPRDTSQYNSRITFSKPQGLNKALCELAPMVAVLIATRDIRSGEELMYNYGSDKPFEHFRKEMQRQEEARRRQQQSDAICKLTWVKN